MLKEALEYLAGLAANATKPVKLEGDDPYALHYLMGDGSVVKVPIDPPAREHHLDQLEDLIRLASRFHGEEPWNPVVWYDERGVVLVLDDDGHRAQSAVLILVESDLFAAARKLATSSFDHRSFVRLLRVQLAGVLPSSELLDIVRRVKFENGTITQGEVRKSRESLGREVTAAVSAEGEIPDAVVLHIPVYKTFGESHPYPLRCTVEADPIEGRFRLLPFPDEIERAQQLAIGSIAERLNEHLPEGVPAYYGRP